MKKFLIIYLISASVFIVIVGYTVDHSLFLKSIYTVFKDLIAPIITIMGIIVAYPFLKKKLIENHISNALTKIQETNRSVLVDSQRLIDKYVSLQNKEFFIRKGDVESSFEEILNLYHNAQVASSEVVTMLFYLKKTLQAFLKVYDDKEFSFFTSHAFYPFLISTLENTIFYCTKVVYAPKSTDTVEKTLIHKKLRKYISNGNYVKYKHFDQGVYLMSNSAQHLLFYQYVNRTGVAQLKRAAFKIHSEPAPIALLLYLQEIYAPLILESPLGNDFFGSTWNSTLHLVGFSIKIQNNLDSGTSTQIVELDYSNLSENIGFVKDLKEQEFINSFKDVFIVNSNFNLKDLINYKTKYNEVITVHFKHEMLKEELFKLRRQFKAKLKF